MNEDSTVVTPASAALPGRWWAGDADLSPGRALRAVVVAAEVPSSVTVEKVVYTQHASDDDGGRRGTGRYLFEADRDARSALDSLPDESDDR